MVALAVVVLDVTGDTGACTNGVSSIVVNGDTGACNLGVSKASGANGACNLGPSGIPVDEDAGTSTNCMPSARGYGDRGVCCVRRRGEWHRIGI